MASQQFTKPAPNAQKLAQVIQSNRWCTSCQMGIHCGGCVCCSDHHKQKGTIPFDGSPVPYETGDNISLAEMGF